MDPLEDIKHVLPILEQVGSEIQKWREQEERKLHDAKQRFQECDVHSHKMLRMVESLTEMVGDQGKKSLTKGQRSGVVRRDSNA